MRIASACRPLALAAALLLGSAVAAPVAAQPAPAGPVVTVLTLKAKEGRTGDFEAAFRDFIQKVDASGLAMHFQLTRTATPGTYKLVEIFRDDAAIAAHNDAAHTKAFIPAVGELLDGPPQVERLNPVG